MSGAVAGRPAGAEGEKGRVETTKVKRYRPGQVPEWMKGDDDAVELPTAAKAPPAQQRTAIAAPVVIKKQQDPRLARLAAASTVDRGAALRARRRAQEEAADDVAAGVANAAPRKIAPPQIVTRRAVPGEGISIEEEDVSVFRKAKTKEEEESEEESEEAIAARRAALRTRLIEQERAAAAAAAAGENGQAAGVTSSEEGEEESGSSEYTEDSDEEAYFGHHPLAKPVFVPRGVRETVAERAAREAEEEAAMERQRQRLEERKLETKEIVAQRLAEEQAQAVAKESGPRGLEDVVTDDEALNEEEEYEGWKGRELARLARDKEDRDREARETAERERWKSLTEEERLAELAARGPKQAAVEAPKKSWGFLQKYYHRGAFFQTEAEHKGEAAPLADLAASRDFSAPTGEDRVDKSALPSVMQVKNFGKRGRTKWTHLAAEDTTRAQEQDGAGVPLLPRHHKDQRPRAGVDQVFTRPTRTKT